MRTLPYKLTGKEVPAALVGTIINIRVPENYKEAESLTKNGESDVVAKFGDGYVIALQGKLRTRSGKKREDGSLVETAESLQKIGDEYVYAVQAEGAPKAVKPETVGQRAAKNVGNKIFERALTDEKFRALMQKNDMLEGFDDWRAAREAAKPAATPQA
jgi:hypothetical protein